MATSEVDPTGHAEAVQQHVDLRPETSVDESKAKAACNGDVWDADDRLLWTNDNPQFMGLVGATADGDEDVPVDTTMDTWTAQASAINACVQRPGLFLFNHDRRRQFIPRAPREVLAAALSGDSHHGFSSKHATGAVNHLALATLFHCPELLDRASPCQLVVDEEQLKLFEDDARGNDQSCDEAHAIRRALGQIVQWCSKATTGNLQPANLWEHCFTDPATDDVVLHQTRISASCHPVSSLEQKLTKDQISVQLTTALRRHEHSRQAARQKSTEAALEITRVDVTENQEQLRRR